jgi:hypothetical protein
MGVDGIVSDVMRYLDIVFWPMICILYGRKAYDFGGRGPENLFFGQLFPLLVTDGCMAVVAHEVSE